MSDERKGKEWNGTERKERRTKRRKIKFTSALQSERFRRKMTFLLMKQFVLFLVTSGQKPKMSNSFFSVESNFIKGEKVTAVVKMSYETARMFFIFSILSSASQHHYHCQEKMTTTTTFSVVAMINKIDRAKIVTLC